MKNIIKKIIMLAALVTFVIFVAGCTVNVPAESTTTTASPTTTSGLETTTTITTTTITERVWGPADVSIKMITKEMGCDNIGGFYTLHPELTVATDFPYEAASITFTMTGGDFPEIYTLEVKADGSYKTSDIYDYADSCDVVFQAEVTAVTLH